VKWSRRHVNAYHKSRFFGPSRSTKFYVVCVVSAIAIGPLIIWPGLPERLLASNFLPHQYCDLRNPGLLWTHAVADSLIGIAYLAISVTLGYLAYKAHRDIPLPWMFLAFGLFIIACGSTPFMEVIPIWIPVYVFTAAVKLFTAAVSLTTAAVLPFTLPRIPTLVQHAKTSEQNTATLRASEERKEALLREVHHRVDFAEYAQAPKDIPVAPYSTGLSFPIGDAIRLQRPAQTFSAPLPPLNFSVPRAG